MKSEFTLSDYCHHRHYSYSYACWCALSYKLTVIRDEDRREVLTLVGRRMFLVGSMYERYPRMQLLNGVDSTNWLFYDDKHRATIQPLGE